MFRGVRDSGHSPRPAAWMLARCLRVGGQGGLLSVRAGSDSSTAEERVLAYKAGHLVDFNGGRAIGADRRIWVANGSAAAVGDGWAAEEGRLVDSAAAAIVVRWAEVHRLAVAGRQQVIARDVGARVSRVWLGVSRFADVAALSRQTLTLGPDTVALNDLGMALSATGQPRQALAYYQQALPITREVGDRAGEGATLTNIGRVYHGLGDRQRALDYYQQSLPIMRDVGNRAGEAVTLNNIGGVYDRLLGDRRQALDYYHQSLPIMRDVGNRAGEAATLNNIGGVYHGLGDRRQALAYYHQALPIRREVGDRAGEAVTLNNIGGVYNGLGDGQRALVYCQQVLPILREVGDRAGESATRYNIAMIHHTHGDLDEAIRELELVVELDRQVEHPDLASDTAMLEQVRRERAQGHNS